MLLRRYLAAGLIARRIGGKVELLVHEREGLRGPNAGRKRVEFPGGMDEPSDNGNPEKTLRAEVEEETGLRIKDDANIRLLLTVQLKKLDVLFLLVWRGACRGTLRTEPVRDGNAILHPPFWADIGFLKSRLRQAHCSALAEFERLISS